mgnify:CR=1 FL=1
MNSIKKEEDIAEALYNAGYRKTSNVVSGILGDVDDHLTRSEEVLRKHARATEHLFVVTIHKRLMEKLKANYGECKP